MARWKGYSTAQVIQAIEENGLVSLWIRCQIQEIARALEQFPSDQFVALNLNHETLVEPSELFGLGGP
jgi:EAL domain-containing protein (putative c-di-GMP-specific phosphodiesterase class I)